MRKEVKKIKYYLILAFIFLIFIFVFVIIKNKYHQIVLPQNNENLSKNTDKKIIEDQFSRVSFFLTTQNMASIALPASWEGKYRKIEAGNVVHFEYIINQDLIFDIFKIKYYPKVINSKLEQNELLVPDSENFTYIKADTNPYVGSDRENFNNMLDRVDELIKGFK